MVEMSGSPYKVGLLTELAIQGIFGPPQSFGVFLDSIFPEKTVHGIIIRKV